jgi:hypothetical protein
MFCSPTGTAQNTRKVLSSILRGATKSYAGRDIVLGRRAGLLMAEMVGDAVGELTAARIDPDVPLSACGTTLGTPARSQSFSSACSSQRRV